MKQILACLSPSPSNPKILRAAADLARGDRELIALFVETPAFSRLSGKDRQRLQENTQEARRLGARVQTVSGDDVAFQIAEYARLSEIETIVLGQSDFASLQRPSKPTLPDRLAELLPDAEIHVIPDRRRSIRFPVRRERVGRQRILFDTVFTVLMLLAATLIGLLLYRHGLSSSSIMMVYLLSILLVSVTTSQRWYSGVSSVIILFLFNYFFVQPRFSLKVYESGYPVSFFVMFLTAMITGTLANRLKRNAQQSAETAFRTRIISETDQLLAKASTREEIMTICARQSSSLLGREVMLYETDGKSIGRRYPWPEDSAAGPETPSVLLEDLAGGRVGPLIYPVGIRDRLYAVLCVTERKPLPEISAQSTLQSILGECALALENEKNVREKESAAILAENERVRADLLRSISHDLRTPLTSISGNAGALLENEARFDPETRHRLTRDIYEDSLWLTELVENLLTTTRLEGGAARIQCHSELVEDILRDAVSHIRPDSGRSIRIAPLKEILLVRVDARLIVQVLVNLAGNAVKYTPPDAEICLSAEREGDRVVISVADTGPGIPDEEKERVFEMFYVGKNRDTVGRKSLGLGLTLCRSIVQAHGGTIWVSDNDPHGAVFRFSLPLEEVPEHG